MLNNKCIDTLYVRWYGYSHPCFISKSPLNEKVNKDIIKIKKREIKRFFLRWTEYFKHLLSYHVINIKKYLFLNGLIKKNIFLSMI